MYYYSFTVHCINMFWFWKKSCCLAWYLFNEILLWNTCKHIQVVHYLAVLWQEWEVNWVMMLGIIRQFISKGTGCSGGCCIDNKSIIHHPENHSPVWQDESTLWMILWICHAGIVTWDWTVGFCVSVPISILLFFLKLKPCFCLIECSQRCNEGKLLTGD